MSSSVDWQLCLKLNNNNSDSAQELLRLFLQELPDFQQRIRMANQSRDIVALREVIHKLHGACCYCGVPKLKSIIEQLEAKLRISTNRVDALIGDLDQEIDNVIKILRTKSYAKSN